jgi:hypothetical protein
VAAKRDEDLMTTFHADLAAAYDGGDAATVERTFMVVFAWSMRDELGDTADDQAAGDVPSAQASHAEADVSRSSRSRSRRLHLPPVAERDHTRARRT